MAINRREGIEALAKIDETSRKLQNEGLDREALDCMQLGLLKRRELFGPKSKELSSACRNVGEALNNIALKNISASVPNFNLAIEYLKQAVKLMQNDDAGKHSTFLNFAALYQKRGEPRVALRYLKQVLAIQQSQPGLTSDDKRATVHLNVCATLSCLGKHESALRHAKIAIRILENLLQESSQRTQNDSQGQLTRTTSSSRKMIPDMEAIDENASGLHSVDEQVLFHSDEKIIEILAASYYNAGVEYEHLGDIQTSYHKYQHGNRISASLGDHNAITKALNASSQALVTRIVQWGLVKDIQNANGNLRVAS